MLCNARQRYAYEGLATLSNVVLACAYLCLTMLGYAMLRYCMLSYATHSYAMVSLCLALRGHAMSCLAEATFRIDLYVGSTSLGHLLGIGLRRPLFV